MIALFKTLSSLRLTLVGALLLAAGLVADQNAWLPDVWAITPPLALLAVNLGVALIVDPRFHRQPALFAFHLCLLLLAVLAGYGQLAAYQGRLPLVEGQAFAADLMETVSAGPLAPKPLADGALRQGPIEVDYAPGQYRGATRSRLWSTDRGWLEVGDDIPLIVDGYRLYTTSNKGFAALLLWVPEQGQPQLGAVHFPSYPAHELSQETAWRTPAGQELHLSLPLRATPFDAHWTLSTERAGMAPIEVRIGERRRTLPVGDSIALDGGRLQYQRLGMWMGYEVRYDPTLPWLFALGVLAVIFMTVHVSGRLWQQTRSHAAADDGCTA